MFIILMFLFLVPSHKLTFRLVRKETGVVALLLIHCLLLLCYVVFVCHLF